MIKYITAGIAAAGLAVTAFALPASASTHKPVNWTARTCSAFRTWDRHRSEGRLAVLVVDSTHLGRSYLKADVGQLYADASSPSKKAAKYLGDDATYVNQDCGG